MKFSYQWLKEWVDPAVTAEQLAELLTMAGLEVDEFSPVAGRLENIVVGRIESVAPHPDADKLRICQVAGGPDGLSQVVCGAPNAEQGLVAPFALIGARLGDIKIRKAKLRGVESSGMLCSGRELGLGEDHDGLLPLPADLTIGQPLQQALQLDDHSIDVDLTPNRADCLSIKGLANEVAALTESKVTHPQLADIEAQTDQVRDVQLESADDCPRYVGRHIANIDASAPAPWWMREKLRRCGVRSISLAVDVTNYVLLELGQPMHAYDDDRLQGAIRVRHAHDGEKLVLLDEKEVTLDESILVIADDSGAIGAAGVMGGLSTAVTTRTTNIFLEAAWFNPASIMGKARDLGLHTDASHRFERGVDPTGQIRAMQRATELLVSIGGGQPGPIIEAKFEEKLPSRPPVGLRSQRIERILGHAIDSAEVERILTALDMQVAATEDGWMVTPPGARFDIEIEEDLIEEVARVYGYNRLPARSLNGTVRFSPATESAIETSTLRNILVDRGYFEAVNYSFVGLDLLQAMGMEEGAIPLANPLSADIGIMRPALLPGLLMAASYNRSRQQDSIRLTESGTVFNRPKQEIVERQHIAGVICGYARGIEWTEKRRPADFYDIKGDVEALIEASGDAGSFQWRIGGPDHLHPGRSATLIRNGEKVGALGALHPATAKSLDLPADTYCFEFDLALLAPASLPIAAELSKFPSIRRDIALELAESVEFESVRKVATEQAGKLLKNLVLFDVYRGEGVETGCKSIAMGLILQDTSRTLTDSEVDETMLRVINGLESNLGARLRG
ncbi:MAG: phenylalanine--tRNA ligase beta subunit [Lysobacteraceae bacterium]|nr:MAG: phenylalanine--tRNA ligase beta subunit [Xanthomonadaceae bacterium]